MIVRINEKAARITPTTAADSNLPEVAYSNISRDIVRKPGPDSKVIVLMSRIHATKVSSITVVIVGAIRGNTILRSVVRVVAPDMAAASSISIEIWRIEDEMI